MSLRVMTQGGGAGGEFASIFVTGLSEADIVTAVKGGRVVRGKWAQDTKQVFVETPVDGGVASSSSIYGNAYTADKAFIGQEWVGGAESVYWLQYEFPTPVIIKNLSFRTDSDSRRTIKGFQFQGSENASAWDTLYSTSTSYGSGVTFTSEIQNTKAYKYYRIYMPQSGDINSSPGMFAVKFSGFEFVDISFFEISPIKSYGMWTVTATDGEDTAQQDVMVDAAIEYEIPMDYTPNYTMLYDFGDECTDITGGWTGRFADSKYTTGGSYTKNAKNLYLSKTGEGYPQPQFGTNKSVDVEGYSGLAVVSTYYWSAPGSSATYAMGFGVLADNNTSYSDGQTKLIRKWYYGGSGTQSKKQVWFSGDHDSTDFGNFSDLGDLYIYVCLFGSQTGETRGNISYYNVLLFKEDNWQKLCTLAGVAVPDSLADLLEDSTACAQILASPEAVRHMTINCTGEFMAHAMASDTFLAALSASELSADVYANKHWAKFLAMMQ